MSTHDSPWWMEKVFYQVYPLSFRDANGDGLGDLHGITEKIPYLRDLGIGGLWICPFYDSPLEHDFGYGPADLLKINPLLGTMEDFYNLVERGHSAGIRILLEWAATNTSIQSAWFKESCSSRCNPKADWYHWFDEIPNNWVSYSGGSAWHWHPNRNQYYLGLFFREHAELNWRNPDVRRAVLDAFESWVTTGIDGFRIDTIDMYVKDAHFRDNPVKQVDTRRYLDPSDPIHDSRYILQLIPEHLQFEHLYDRGQPETEDIMREMRAICDRHGKDLLLIGEVDVQTPAGRALCASGMSVAFNFSLAYSPWGAASFRRALQAETGALNAFLCCNAFSNHDVRRAISRFGTGSPGEDFQRARLLAVMTLTLPGVPMIYYGEELGMPDVQLERRELRDPMSLNSWNIGAIRESSRAPMPWGSGPSFGFSTGRPWMKMADTHGGRQTVELQAQDPLSMLSLYKRLIGMRNSSAVLKHGEFSLAGPESESILAYQRKLANESLTVVMNLSNQPGTIPLSEYGISSAASTVVFTLCGSHDMTHDTIHLEPYDAIIASDSLSTAPMTHAMKGRQ